MLNTVSMFALKQIIWFTFSIAYIMYLVKHNNINLPVIVLLLSMIVSSILSSSRVTAVSEEHKVTSNLVTIEIFSKILMS